MPRPGSILSFAALVLALLADAASAAPRSSVEEAIHRQDELAGKGDTVRLLNEAKARVQAKDTAQTRYLLGRAYGLSGEYDKAREQFDWAVEKDPASPYGYHGLGICYLMQRKLEEAERQLEHAISLDPKFTRAHVEIGRIQMTRGDRVAAQREFLGVLEYDPGNLDVRILLAHLYLQTKQYDKADQEFMVVLSKDPENLPARKGYALTLYLSRRTEKAIKEFRRYVEQEPKDYEAYLFLKDALLRTDRREEAVEVLRQLIAALPEESSLIREAKMQIESIESGAPVAPENLSLPQILARLDSDSSEERYEAMRFLVSLGIAPPPGRMVRAVKDEDPRIRVLAVRNLGNVGGPLAVGVLEALLVDPRDADESEQVRGAAARGLQDIGSPSGIPVLLAALADESHYVFKLVVDALRSLGGRSFVDNAALPVEPSQREELTKAWRGWWNGPRAFGRKLDAANAIGELRQKRLSAYLIELLTDEDRPVAAAAKQAFEALVGSSLGPESDLDSPEGRQRLRRNAVKLVLTELPKKHGAGKPADGKPADGTPTDGTPADGSGSGKK